MAGGLGGLKRKKRVALIADGERLYDPRAYHDRLLLGLSGIMSEAELHQIRMRLHQGERQKAARGELRLPLPAGLAHDRGATIILNPDEEVQARLNLVFAKFRELQSARSVMGFLRTSGLPLPVRPVLGPSPHDVVWRDADSARVRGVLLKSGLCWGLCLRPSAEGREPMAPRFGWGNRQGGNRGLGGLPESRSPWLHRLGGVHGQSAPLGGQRQPLRSGTHRRAAQRFGVATGHRNLRTLWTSHEPALHGAEWRLPGLLLPVRSRSARRRAVPGSARLASRRAR